MVLASVLAAAMGVAIASFPATTAAMDIPDPTQSRSYSISRTTDRFDTQGRTESLSDDPVLTMTVVDVQVRSPSRRNKPGSPSATGPVCISSPIEPGRYRVSSPQGMRNNPFSGRVSLHAGVDLAAPFTTKIHAVADGVVTYTGPGRAGRSSELVIIDHEVDGTQFSSWYVHMYADGVFVEAGQHVRSGEVIAEVGSNGNSTGPHLHFEIHTRPVAIGGVGKVVMPGMRVLGPDVDLVEPQESVDQVFAASEDTTGEHSTAPPATAKLAADPSGDPSEEPTGDPSEQPSTEPGAESTGDPSGELGAEPDAKSTGDPSEEPGAEPAADTVVEEPSEEPGAEPAADTVVEEPSEEPGAEPGEDDAVEEPSESADPDAVDETEESEEIIVEITGELTDPVGSVVSGPTGIYDPSSYGILHDPLPFLMSLGYGISSPAFCLG